MLLPFMSLPVPVEIDQPWLESSDDEILSDNSEECDGDQDQDPVQSDQGEDLSSSVPRSLISDNSDPQPRRGRRKKKEPERYGW
ncbi:hypothetical protein DPMN_013948 [Dreissena polymorpha]|uniref:Uncharacterized protein n=1 Tax=Dreissena polymorpha TaxID=45954 RepID=A0A9D4N8A2_DREPO|nr:hypothetical protein DPMN_013948 [Dreissena polymorpha]